LWVIMFSKTTFRPRLNQYWTASRKQYQRSRRTYGLSLPAWGGLHQIQVDAILRN